MKKYQIKIELKVKKDWADPTDFEKEIEEFNEANKGILEAEIKELKESEQDSFAVLSLCRDDLKEQGYPAKK